MDLREARFKRLVTQWALSKKTGVHQSRISLLEQGEIPKEKEKQALSAALGFKADDIKWPEE